MLVSRSDRSRSSVERASVTKRDIERDTRNLTITGHSEDGCGRAHAAHSSPQRVHTMHTAHTRALSPQHTPPGRSKDRDATFHASRSRGGSNGRRPVLGCRIGGPAGALGVIQRHGRGRGDDRLLRNIACAIHATMAPAFVHQHAPQIHLQHAPHIDESPIGA